MHMKYKHEFLRYLLHKKAHYFIFTPPFTFILDYHLKHADVAILSCLKMLETEFKIITLHVTNLSECAHVVELLGFAPIFFIRRQLCWKTHWDIMKARKKFYIDFEVNFYYDLREILLVVIFFLHICYVLIQNKMIFKIINIYFMSLKVISLNVISWVWKYIL